MGISAACAALSLPRSSFYRPAVVPAATTDVEAEPAVGADAVVEVDPAVGVTVDGVPRQPRSHPRALSSEQRQRILDEMSSERFIDRSPAHVVAVLLDEGIYLASVRTFYRVLVADAPLQERRAQRRHPVYSAPELLATGPNQVWSWDITKIKGSTKGTWYHLYVIIDLFSRYVVGWAVYDRESKMLAENLIRVTCERQQIKAGELTLHADRGSAMRSTEVAELLGSLGVEKSHSRPYCSNDNPYSESQFKTMKYSPEYPERFGSLQDARVFGAVFFWWYNTEHRHSGIAMLTPVSVHYGHAEQILANRTQVLEDAWRRNPERFVNGVPTAGSLPDAVWINKPSELVSATAN